MERVRTTLATALARALGPAAPPCSLLRGNDGSFYLSMKYVFPAASSAWTLQEAGRIAKEMRGAVEAHGIDGAHVEANGVNVHIKLDDGMLLRHVMSCCSLDG